MTVSKRARGIASACIAVLFVVGCATAGSSSGNSDRIVPPQMTSRASMPPLQFPMSSATGSPIEIDLEVAVDSTGVPVMSTFKAYGPMATENRDALYQYIASSRFRPSLLNGQPVSGVYHTQLKFRLQR